MGIYADSGSGLVFLSWDDLSEKGAVVEVLQGFEDRWPDRWSEIQASIPESPIPFLDDGYIRSRTVEESSDLYWLTRFDLLLAGIGEKTTEKVLNSIAKSKRQPFHRCLFGLAIPDVGSQTSKELATRYRDIDTLGRVPFHELVTHSGVGATLADSLLRYFHKESSWKTIEKLRLGGLDGLFGWEPEKLKPTVSPVTDKEFMFTGRLSLTRAKAQLLVIQRGGFIGSSVNKDTDYLVVGEDPGEKLFKGQMLGTKILTEEEFFNMLEGKPCQ